MSSAKRIYIAGAGGMLGEAFYTVFRQQFTLACSDIDVNEEWLSYLDMRDLSSYREAVKAHQPDYLFHLGALTDLEYCEQNPQDAWHTNTLAVENAVYIANELDIPLLYISTAGIFDGSKDTFDDWDTPNPMGMYARSKYAGELFVQQSCRRHLICRAGWMMGGGPRKDKKFIQKIMAQLRGGAKELYIVNDKLGTPTYTHDFARTVQHLLEKEYWGLYNMVCDGVTNRLEVAKELVNATGLAGEVNIVPVSSAHFSETYFAPRPSSERLINTKLELRKANRMRDWKTCLHEYIQLYYEGYLNKTGAGKIVQ
jgi:dTDP-4-dehydrorhamnose reductase